MLLAFRVFNTANVNKLFLGLYFCQTPVAQKQVKESATHMGNGNRSRGRSKPLNNLLITRPSVLSKNLQTTLIETKVTAALENHQKHIETEGIKDTLNYFKKQIVKNRLQEMGKNVKNTPLMGRGNRRAVSPNMRGGTGARRGVTPPQILPQSQPQPLQKHKSLDSSGGNGGVSLSSGGRKRLHSPADQRTKSFIKRKVMLDSVKSYRKTIQNYKIPSRLINLSAHSQLDSNSIFANQLR